MKEEKLLKITRFLIKWGGLLLPALIGSILYYLTDNMFFTILFFFVFINKGLFDVYEAIMELKDEQAKENRQWINSLTKRKSL